MSYHIYTTSGIILKSAPIGESDSLLHILTQDFGLILASAKSVRVSKSKLRPALLEYNLVTLSCIKGKNGWKLTNISSDISFYYSLSAKGQKILAQISTVLLKMIAGEIAHREIFDLVKSGLIYLKGIPDSELSNFETLIVLRVLNELGYIEKSEVTRDYISKNDEWNTILLDGVSKDRKKLVEVINKAFKESHL